MEEQCTHDCSTCSQNCAERDFHENTNEYSHVKHVIGVVSGKGGVGKSLVTSLLAAQMARRGFRTAVLDADVTGPSIPRIFGLKEKAAGDEKYLFPVVSKTGIKIISLNLLLENDTDPVIWRGPVIAGLVKQFWTEVVWDDVDVMFIDMPPGTGDVPLTVFQTIRLDGIVIVTSPQELVGMIVEKAANMAKTMNIPVIGLVENMSYLNCPNCGEKIFPFGESRSEQIAASFGIENFASLPIDPKFAESCDSGEIEDCKGDWLDVFCTKLLKTVKAI